jgi:spermidine/putrescine transport system substrate-binding protein
MARNIVVDRLRSGRMTRREFAQALGALGIGMVMVPQFAGRALAGPADLVYFTWAGYDIPDIHKGYIDKYGAGPTYGLFGGTEEAFQKIMAGYNCDVAHPCVEDTTRWRAAGLTQKLDPSRLAHYADIYPELFNLPGAMQDGEPWFLPFDWGNGSLLYRTDIVELDGEESWNLAFDERYKGKIAMYNATPTVSVAALALGIDPYEFSDAEGEKIKAALIKQRELVRFYWDSPTEIQQALASGEIAIAYAWNDSLAAMLKQGVPVKYMKPKEGILSWTCGLVHMANAKATDEEVYTFFDAMTAPETGKFLIEQYAYGHCNKKSFEISDPKIVADLGFSSPTDLFQNSVFETEVSKEMETKRNTIFEEVKAGSN